MWDEDPEREVERLGRQAREAHRKGKFMVVMLLGSGRREEA